MRGSKVLWHSRCKKGRGISACGRVGLIIKDSDRDIRAVPARRPTSLLSLALIWPRLEACHGTIARLPVGSDTSSR